MKSTPAPIAFQPIFKAKPWGGRKLEELFRKSLPPGERIGESWELAHLPPPPAQDRSAYESAVRSGPMKGRFVGDVLDSWGSGLVGGVELIDGRLPLLIKFLDARENLSVQVHPRPPGSDARPRKAPAPIKHEAWYVVAADPGAQLYIGVKPGVTAEDLARAADTPRMAELLRAWPATPGACYYLPSGTLHALGAGVVVAEVQTPSDTTYRIYDWNRTDLHGRPRDLHIPEALANVDLAIRDEQIRQPRRHVAGVLFTASQLVRTERFTIDKVRATEGLNEPILYGEMAVWVILAGKGAVQAAGAACPFAAGDVILIPAEAKDARVICDVNCEWLEVKVPIRSSLADFERPEPETPTSLPGGITPLTISGRSAPRP